MAYFDQGDFELCCEWGIGGVERLAPADVLIVVDVLSFTTCVDVALSRGVTVFPYRWKDDSAAQYARDRNAELAGSRKDLDGKYSLSPSSLIDAPAGLRLVLPSPNGASLVFAAMSRGVVVLAGCLRNASAVAAWARRTGKRIVVVPAGERWPDGTLRPAFEDLVGAGAILSALPGARSPEAQMAVSAFEDSKSELRERLFLCSSGRELSECGFGYDVELASERDVSDIVAVLKEDAFRSQ